MCRRDSFGIQQPIYLPDFVDGATYMEYINEANRNTTGVDKYTPEQIRITREGSDPIHYPSTDWMKETMRETAPIHEHNFTVSGGNTTARFALSAQYLNQDGMYKVMDNGFERLTVRANTTVNLNKDIMMFVDMFVGRDTQRQPETMNKTILDYIYLAPPTLVSKYPRKEGQKPGYDYYGVYFEWMNPDVYKRQDERQARPRDAAVGLRGARRGLSAHGRGRVGGGADAAHRQYQQPLPLRLRGAPLHRGVEPGRPVAPLCDRYGACGRHAAQGGLPAGYSACRDQIRHF